MIMIAIILVALNGPDGQTIYVNPTEVVSIREPTSELIHENIKCTLQTADGKLINVVNDCEDVKKKISGGMW